MPTTKAIITTLDNLPILMEQIAILEADPVISEIIVVCNGSQDGTVEWLGSHPELTSIIRENLGAGPGRNAGIDAAEPFDYLLFLDGGIRPLHGGTAHMLDYLEHYLEVGVIGVEIADFETDYDRAWRRWPYPIGDESTYQNLRLSYTAYCLTRARAWDNLRFCEEGPFAQPGWGADDDEMAYQWRAAGITVHVITCACRRKDPCNGVHPYRRASGSFRRLYKETGVWPNQYGSVYEQRLVWLQQRWPQYGPGVMWGEPEETIKISVGDRDLEDAIREIKSTHDRMRENRYESPWQNAWHPYHVVVDCPVDRMDFLEWAELRRLRQHHGDKIIIDNQIIKRDDSNRDLWTGDFIVRMDNGNTDE